MLKEQDSVIPKKGVRALERSGGGAGRGNSMVNNNGASKDVVDLTSATGGNVFTHNVNIIMRPDDEKELQHSTAAIANLRSTIETLQSVDAELFATQINETSNGGCTHGTS